ncbi:hypothetical protein Tco_1390979, partial [Tanacetum coccineum]
MLNPSTTSSDASPVKIEAPKELPKVSLVNKSLKKLKFHLAKFDNVVKIRTTPDASTEVNGSLEWRICEYGKKEMNLVYHMSNPSKKSSDASPVKMEAPKELPKVSLVNESLKKLKFQLDKFDNMVKIRTTLDARTEEFFENNDLKARLQDKDTTICKLKEIIKSMREKSKEENVNYDYCEIETKNVELENSVTKLLLENERLCKEINHVKQ